MSAATHVITSSDPIIDAMAQFRKAWIHADYWHLKFAAKLPPMNWEQAHAAREDAYAAYYDTFDPACHNRALYKAQLDAIERAAL